MHLHKIRESLKKSQTLEVYRLKLGARVIWLSAIKGKKPFSPSSQHGVALRTQRKGGARPTEAPQTHAPPRKLHAQISRLSSVYILKYRYRN